MRQKSMRSKSKNSPAGYGITHLGPLGDGVAEHESGPVFVDRAAPGDQVTLRLRRDPQGILRGEIAEILSPSDFRATPPCLFYAQCGNCTLQHLEPAFYRAWKVETVREALRRQRVLVAHWAEPIFVGAAQRRRLTWNAVRDRRKLVLGFHPRRSKTVSEIRECKVSEPSLFALHEPLQKALECVALPLGAVDVFVQKASNGAVDMVLVGAVGRRGQPDVGVEQAFAPLLELGQIARLSWRETAGASVEVLAEAQPVLQRFGKLQVSLPPFAFLQPTQAGESALVKAVLAGLPAAGNFVDLFSGCGTFTGPLLDRGSVLALEWDLPAVKALQTAAGKKARIIRRDLFTNPLRSSELENIDAVVLDPPRAGALEQVKQLAHSSVSKIVYISCNPATFARDAKVLTLNGFRLDQVHVVDQFQWSHHVEVVGIFSNRP